MELDLQEDAEYPSDDSLTKEACALMQRKLPEYVVNCLVAAGYDTLDVIAEMDVSYDPGNSIQVIEDFIAKEHPDDPQFIRSTMAPSSFKFPPGHRQRSLSKKWRNIKQRRGICKQVAKEKLNLVPRSQKG